MSYLSGLKPGPPHSFRGCLARPATLSIENQEVYNDVVTDPSAQELRHHHPKDWDTVLVYNPSEVQMGADRQLHVLTDSTAASIPLTGRFPLLEKAILLSPRDNVAVVRQPLGRGSELVAPDGAVITLQDTITTGHKLALRPIAQGERVYKYSQIIGNAGRPIQPGEWVHTHNLELAHELGSHEFALDHPRPPALSEDLPRTFLGYRRPDGKVGTRSHIAIVAISNCASHVCEGIAEEFRRVQEEGFDGIFALPHKEGCGHHAGPDVDQLERTLKGIIIHPNVAAVMVVGLGCEVNSLSRYVGPDLETRYEKPAAALEIQTAGGTLKSINEGVKKVHELVAVAKTRRRTPESVEHLLVGLNCGGSDAFSGISANPALGCASDLLVAAGGAVVLAETPEIYGAEQVLTRRAVDIETGKKLIHIIERYQEYAGRFGATMNSNPAPGNLRGGITNIVEKSLGAVMKGGSTMLAGVVDYAERIVAKGLVVMDTPGYDPVSITGLAAGGCNVIAFTTGRGSAIGFPIVPVLKIATNSRTFHTMNDNMDVNAGEIVDGSCNIEEKGIEIYKHIIRVASGERSKSELLGHKEFAPWRIGPVM
ncbi:MAG TPA: altronate dehydratase family protein [Acidobacteriota bacterium]|nr:altronate dehydratase family protein [Acidobacteriota bacterium]